MQDDEFQKLMVRGMADGIEAYINEKKEEESGNNDIEEDAMSEEEQPEDSDTAATEASDTAATEDSDAAGTEIAAATEPDEDEFEFLDELDPEEEEREREKARLKEEKRAREAKEQALRDALASTDFAPARKTERSAKEAGKIIKEVGDEVIKRYKEELYASTVAQMTELEEELSEEIGKLGGKWSLYLKRLDTNQVIGINDDEKMVAASLIKLFVAGTFYTLGEQGEFDIDDYFDLPDLMITISDNGAANSLINACTMEKVNEFAKENGFMETELNRRMLEWNGTENYTSTRDCGRLLEEVLKGEFVSEDASERILDDLKNQQKTGKIPAGVPEGVETGNKTGELDNVDNDAAIVWSPSCTYVLCIMSSDTGGRIAEIRKLSGMVYEAINPSQD